MSIFSLSEALRTISFSCTQTLSEASSLFTNLQVFWTAVTLNPLSVCAWLLLALVAIQLILSAIYRSFSWNDRFWPFIPAIHALTFVLHPILLHKPTTTTLKSLDGRLFIMSSIVFMWSIRLTRHAFNRGVYRYGALDYRYRWLRTHIITNQYLYAIFYVLIVCFSFSFLLSLIVMPMYFAWLVRFEVPLNIVDGLAIISSLSSIAFEAIADTQQQAFHCAKAAFYQNYDKQFRQTKRDNRRFRPRHSAETLGADFDDGFLQSGLFAYCRHPNFFGELSLWFSFHIFSLATGAPILNWTILGPILYLALFCGSTAITEHLSSKKYPLYNDYCKRVPRFLPSPSCRRGSNHD